MKIIYGPNTAAGLNRPRLTLGTFDGVHRGHQRVIGELLAWARATGTEAAVITFDRKPHRILSGRPFDQITTLPHRLRLFERLGLDAAIILEFDHELAAMEPEAFVEEVVVRRFQAGGVLMGHDTRFGKAGRGDHVLMAALGKQFGFEVRAVEVETLDGAPVSSTRVRQAIRDGDLPLAERMLGRRVSAYGTVVHGTSRGRALGCPTANLDLHHAVHPPEGVYASRALIDGSWHDSVTNIGRPPTLLPDGPPFRSEHIVLETHVMDLREDLYGKDIEVEFVSFLRPEKRYGSADALAEAIRGDVAAARKALAVAAEGRPTP